MKANGLARQGRVVFLEYFICGHFVKMWNSYMFLGDNPIK
jgi:hypothetical protein